MTSDRQTQEQSIKDRKKQLYDADAPAVAVGPHKPFQDVLRSTPAAPLSTATKAALWAVTVVVLLLLVAALMKGPKRTVKTGWAPPSVSQLLT